MKSDRLLTSDFLAFKDTWLPLIPAPLLFACLASTTGPLPLWSLIAALAASLFLLGRALLSHSQPKTAVCLGLLAFSASGVAGYNFFASAPIFALLGGVTLIQAGYFLLETSFGYKEHRQGSNVYRSTKHCLTALSILSLLSFLLNPNHLQLGEQAIAASTLICQVPVARYLRKAPGLMHRVWWLFPLTVAILCVAAVSVQLTAAFALMSSALSLWILPRDYQRLIGRRERWWEPFLNHPARVLISTFFGLCLLGTVLLHLSWASTAEPLSLINAAFTSVSAVCVTGLTVVDTQVDFSPFGQGCLLLLIQLGGLGIMTITTVALQAMGKRMSLRHERLLTTLTETSHQELVSSLVFIVRFTLIVEAAGALLLTFGFALSGAHWMQALWKGLFTSVSAFCNAGFALDSANLLNYRHQPLILHTVALLIILGGLAPSTCMLAGQWLRGRRIDLASRIALVTTSVLLVLGTCSFLMFEWDHVLGGLNFGDKLHNAWFQSVTLRTAGFNSVDLNQVLSPTLLIMLFCMFIGGSPGGTAGGIKTTTLGILALTFWTTITAGKSVIAQNRRIHQSIINRTITVFFAGAIVWFMVVLALILTQAIPVRELVFEATSALATAGLSLGATPKLDVIGKIIIMFTMFIGRIGPMTLFTLLSADHQERHSKYPDARITLS